MEKKKERLKAPGVAVFSLLLAAVFLLPSWAVPARADMGYVQERPNYSDRSQVRYAEFFLRDGDYMAAAMEFGRLIEYFPGSPLIPEAQFKMADAYLSAGRFDEAAWQFEAFIDNFPDSPLVFVAEIKRQGATHGRIVVVEDYETGETGLTEVTRLVEPEESEEREDAPEAIAGVSEEEALEVAEEEGEEWDWKEELLEYETAEEVELPREEAAEPAEVASAEPLTRPVEAEPIKVEDEYALKAPALPAAPLRAMQVMLFDGRDLDDVAAELRTLKAGGVDTIIIRVFHNRGDRLHSHVSRKLLPETGSGVYFATEHAPVVTDFLADLLPLAHGEGLRVLAWMTTRYADYGIEERDEFGCAAYDIDSGDFERCKGLDLFNEEVVERLVSIYRDLAKYPIDGILFQDDLVLRHTEGFGPHAARSYFEDNGTPLDPAGLYLRREYSGGVDYTDEFWQWASWKNRKLLGVAGRLRDVVRQERPDALFAINLMYEAVINPGAGLAWLSQDLNEAIDVGFDYYSIMAYHRQMGEELRKDSTEIQKVIATLVEDAIATVGEPEKVLIKIQSIDWNTSEKLPLSELIDLAKTIRDVGGVSMAVVPYRQDFAYDEVDSEDLALIE